KYFRPRPAGLPIGRSGTGRSAMRALRGPSGQKRFGGRPEARRRRLTTDPRSPAPSDLDSLLNSSGSVCQRMPVPILINEILRRNLAERAEPLRTPRSHPDEIAG